jgi:hypothetical protein
MSEVTIRRKKSLKGAPFKYYPILNGKKLDLPLMNGKEITFNIPSGHHQILVMDHLKKGSNPQEFSIDDDMHLVCECRPGSMLKKNVFNPFKLSGWLSTDLRIDMHLIPLEVIDKQTGEVIGRTKDWEVMMKRQKKVENPCLEFQRDKGSDVK